MWTKLNALLRAHAITRGVMQICWPDVTSFTMLFLFLLPQSQSRKLHPPSCYGSKIMTSGKLQAEWSVSQVLDGLAGNKLHHRADNILHSS